MFIRKNKNRSKICEIYWVNARSSVMGEYEIYKIIGVLHTENVVKKYRMILNYRGP
jgi:hypothetical protein